MSNFLTKTISNNYRMKGFSNSSLLLAVFIVLFSLSGAAQSQSEWLDKPAWNDQPDYFQDSSVDVWFSDDIEDKDSYQSCSSYDNGTYENVTEYSDCISYTTEYYGGQNQYIFGIENIDYYYIGNGNVHLSFEGEFRPRVTCIVFSEVVVSRVSGEVGGVNCLDTVTGDSVKVVSK